MTNEKANQRQPFFKKNKAYESLFSDQPDRTDRLVLSI